MGELSSEEYLATGDKELRRAMATASLRESWRYAEEQGLDKISDKEIDEDIRQARERRLKCKS